MSYSNRFLRDFRPIFLAILKEKRLDPGQLALEIIDEEPGGLGIFEPAGVREVLEQLSEDLNFLTIYTERPAYFYEYAETMYEENGLVVTIFPKEKLRCAANMGIQMVLDFEWEGECYFGQMRPGRYYIPIHKKPWKMGENLDIMIPIGYNTVIVKDIPNKRKKPWGDRFEEAFYSS